MFDFQYRRIPLNTLVGSINHLYIRLGIFALVLSTSIQSSGQQNYFCAVERCITPSYVQTTKSNNANALLDTIIHLQTVVHIVYHRPEQNMPDNAVLKLLVELNDYFRAKGIEMEKVHPAHRSKIADTNIQFCLAAYDPLGRPTNGILHYSTQTSEFEVETETVKYEREGGVSPWDVDRYFNIWIAPMEGSANSNYGVPRQSYFPLGMTISDDLIPGVVMDVDNYLDPSSQPFSSFAGVLAHECGHALGLHHTFGYHPAKQMIILLLVKAFITLDLLPHTGVV